MKLVFCILSRPFKPSAAVVILAPHSEDFLFIYGYYELLFEYSYNFHAFVILKH